MDLRIGPVVAEHLTPAPSLRGGVAHCSAAPPIGNDYQSYDADETTDRAAAFSYWTDLGALHEGGLQRR